MTFIPDNEINVNNQQDDILQTKKYAQALKEIIANTNEQSNIGLYGEWGSGKSSIIKTTQDLFENEKIKFITYDAWKYANDSFRRMFLKTLVNQLPQFDSTELFDSFYQNKNQDKEIKQKFNWKYLVLILFFGFVAIVSSAIFLDTDDNILVFTVQTIVALIAVLLAFFKNAFTDYKLSISKPAIFAPEQFEEAFNEIMHLAFKKNIICKWFKAIDIKDMCIEKLVIVIDNIDRCDKKTSYELLTNLKNFVSKEFNIIFLVPVDDEALKRHMKELNKENDKEADEFLRKFFNTTLKIKHFQSNDLYEFANHLNTKYNLNFDSDTVYIISKEYASNPRRIIQIFNNLTAEIESIKTKHGDDFTKKHQALIAKLLIVREEWAAIFKEITKYPGKFIVFKKFAKLAQQEEGENNKMTEYKYVFDNESFNTFMENTRSINADYNSLERILLNTTSDGLISQEIREFISKNDFENLKAFLSKEPNLLNKIVKYQISELKKGIERNANVQSVNSLVFLSNLHSIRSIDDTNIKELHDILTNDTLINDILNRIKASDVNNFFKFVESFNKIGLMHINDLILKNFQDSYNENGDKLSEIGELYLDGFVSYINNISNVQSLQSMIEPLEYLYSVNDNFSIKSSGIDNNKLKHVIDEHFVGFLIKNLDVTIDPASKSYEDLLFLSEKKFLKTTDIVKILNKLKPDFSKNIVASAPNLDAEHSAILQRLFGNIESMLRLMKNVSHLQNNYNNINEYIVEINKNVTITKQGYGSKQLIILNDISNNENYKELLLKFYCDMYRITGTSDAANNIITLVNKYSDLKDKLFKILIKIRDSENFKLKPLFKFLVDLNDVNINLFNIYEKLFNIKLDDNEKKLVRDKIASLLETMITTTDNDIENLMLKLIQNELSTKEMVADIIITLDIDKIIKLPEGIMKLAYQHLCAPENLTKIENNIELLKVIAVFNVDNNTRIISLAKSKLYLQEKLEDGLGIINAMHLSSEESKDLIIDLKSTLKRIEDEKLKERIKQIIKKIDEK